MNTDIITDLIHKRIETWEHFDKKKFIAENLDFIVPKDELFYRVTMQWGTSQIIGVGSEPEDRERGAVVVEIFAPIGIGTKKLRQLGDSLANHLKHYRTDKLELYTPSQVNVPVDEKLNRYKRNVRVPFRYN